MPTDVDVIRREHIEAFLEDDLSPGLAADTAAGHYQRLQQLSRWLDEEGEIPESPMAKTHWGISQRPNPSASSVERLEPAVVGEGPPLAVIRRRHSDPDHAHG